MGYYCLRRFCLRFYKHNDFEKYNSQYHLHLNVIVELDGLQQQLQHHHLQDGSKLRATVFNARIF